MPTTTRSSLRHPITALALAAILGTSAALAAEPDWVRTGGHSPRHPRERFLVGFAVEEGSALDIAKTKAAADLAMGVTTRIESELRTTDTLVNDVTKSTVASLARATTDVRIDGLLFETATIGDRVYALAYVSREDAATARREARDRAAKHGEAVLTTAKKAEDEGRSTDAMASLYEARVAYLEATEHDTVARAIGRSSSTFDAGPSLVAIDDRIRRAGRSTSASLDDAVAFLLFQLRPQLATLRPRWSVAPLTYATTAFTSVFGREVAASLERRLSVASEGKGDARDLVLKGTYLKVGDDWKLAVLVRETASGCAVASAEARVPRSAIPANVPTLPANFDQAMKDDALLGAGEAVSGDLRLEVWTQKGRSNLVFGAGDEVKFFLRVNKPAWVRLVYLLADGKKVPLEQAYFVDASKVNLAVEYPEKFEVSEPFGVERLFATAFTQKPEPLPTRKVKVATEDYDVLESGTAALVKHRGLKKKAAEAQTAEAQVVLTTMPK